MQKNYNVTGNLYSRVFFFLSLFSILISGCAHKRTVKTAESGQEQITYGPPPPVHSQTIDSGDQEKREVSAENALHEESSQGWTRADELRRKGVILFLGAGLNNSFSAVGLFRALEKSHIPIKGLVCTELSSIICSLYSFFGLSGMEWAVTQIKYENYFDFSLLTLTSIVPLKSGLGNLKSLLNKIFKDRLIENAKVPLYLVAEDKSTETTLYFTKGDLVKALLASQQHPDWGQGLEYDGHNYYSTLEALEDSFNLMNNLSGVPVAMDTKFSPPVEQNKHSKWSLKERAKTHLNTVMSVVLEKQHSIFNKYSQSGLTLLEIPTKVIDISDFSVRAEVVYTSYMKAKEWLNETIKPSADGAQ